MLKMTSKLNLWLDKHKTIGNNKVVSARWPHKATTNM